MFDVFIHCTFNKSILKELLNTLHSALYAIQTYLLKDINYKHL